MILPPLERIPWWGFATAVLTPVALVGGWLTAGATVRGYDPVRSSVSDLAAADSTSRWLMAAALVLTGLGYAATAVALRPADVAGRGLLFVGGVGVLLTAWIPNQEQGRNSVGHMIVTYLAFIALTVWPAVIARNRPDAPWVLRRRFGQVVVIVLGVLLLLTVAEIVVGGATLGLRERVLTTAQALVPLIVAIGCRARSEAP
ncbi:MAG TPA: DUF998 domain-containing protein [Lapillicoccus sp.]|nr:DUF998 domain-containing protein [Lapillicoccus sp.]